MSGFSHRQLKKLATPLDGAKVQSREQGGKTLSYIEGWFAIAEANRIFGYDGWDREMVHCEKLFAQHRSDGTLCGYAARVRIRVRVSATTTITREGTGFGQATAAIPGEAHERALKAAETDATKRALVTFGGRFGLMLYDKENRLVTSPSITKPGTKPLTTPLAQVRASSKPAGYVVLASDGRSIPVQSAESFCSALRQLLEAARTHDEVRGLEQANLSVMAKLRLLPNLKTPRGEHYCEILERLIARRGEELRAAECAPVSDGRATSEQERIVEQSGVAQGVAHKDTPVPHATDPAGSGANPPTTGRQSYRPFAPVPAYPLAALAERIGPVMPEPTAAQSSVETIAALDSGERQELSAAEAGAAASASADHVVSQLAAMADPPVTSAPALPTRRSQISGGFSVDKSALLIPSERRLRSKAHLVFVAAKPCLICEGQPCHAHHITFAQPRGLSQKVSDEFTVPLCVVHHNELHASGNEASWWRAQEIEPLAQASALWRSAASAGE